MTAWRATQVIVFGTSTRHLPNFATMSRVCKFGRFGGWHRNDWASIKSNWFVELTNISGFDTDQRISYRQQNAIRQREDFWTVGPFTSGWLQDHRRSTNAKHYRCSESAEQHGSSTSNRRQSQTSTGQTGKNINPTNKMSQFYLTICIISSQGEQTVYDLASMITDEDDLVPDSSNNYWLEHAVAAGHLHKHKHRRHRRHHKRHWGRHHTEKLFKSVLF